MWIEVGCLEEVDSPANVKRLWSSVRSILSYYHEK